MAALAIGDAPQGQRPRIFYRIVKEDPPTIRDFTPQIQLGRRLIEPSPERQRLATGLSVFATEAQAHRQARAYPLLGSFVAEASIPAGAAVVWERTLRTPGHHTAWGSPAELLNYVTRVVPVRRAP